MGSPMCDRKTDSHARVACSVFSWGILSEVNRHTNGHRKTDLRQKGVLHFDIVVRCLLGSLALCHDGTVILVLYQTG